jgi:hypothetical protein
MQTLVSVQRQANSNILYEHGQTWPQRKKTAERSTIAVVQVSGSPGESYLSFIHNMYSLKFKRGT